MYLAYVLHQSSHLTFGRSTAQFKQLLAFMAIVSIVLWSIVVVTMLARLWACHVWYRRSSSTSNTNLPPP
jgi:hypothetical protein